MHWIASQLWQVDPQDPLTFAAVVGIQLFVGVAASYLTTLAALRVNPAETLRAE